MTLGQLKRNFQKARKRADKAVARYRMLLDSVWVETSDGRLVHATPRAFCWDKSNQKWYFCEFVTDSFDCFYRRGRGEKRLAETWGEFKPFSVKPVAYSEVRKLEMALDAALNEYERVFYTLKERGYDLWNDDELWQ